MTHRFEMSWIDAATIATQVVKIVTISHRAIEETPHQSVTVDGPRDDHPGHDEALVDLTLGHPGP